jgi:sterol desaturase/sphingolipid hydroxylase (fatty acid hydroxylase superfamily)
VSWIQIESRAYWVVFVATFLAVAIWESLRAWRGLSVPAARRWRNQALLLAASTVATQAIFRASPVVAALSVAGSRWGLLNRPWIPFVARCALTILVLDFVKYAVHRACHSVSVLWRVHQVHHSDPDFDVSTAFRVHPIEQVAMQGCYLAAIVICAPPVGAVVVAEVVAGFQSFFEHANARLPHWLETLVGMFVVTPDMHRIHHSDEIEEQNRNFGELFPWWDRLLGTYAASPAAGPDEMTVGLKGYQHAESLGIGFMLRQPFVQEKREAAIVQQAE